MKKQVECIFCSIEGSPNGKDKQHVESLLEAIRKIPADTFKLHKMLREHYDCLEALVRHRHFGDIKTLFDIVAQELDADLNPKSEETEVPKNKLSLLLNEVWFQVIMVRIKESYEKCFILTSDARFESQQVKAVMRMQEIEMALGAYFPTQFKAIETLGKAQLKARADKLFTQYETSKNKPSNDNQNQNDMPKDRYGRFFEKLNMDPSMKETTDLMKQFGLF